MNYEQLEVYFGSPGVSIIYPTIGESFSPGYKDLDFMQTISSEDSWSIRVRWEAIFTVCRDMKNKLKHLRYDRLILRTGILCPKSIEGQRFYGTVLLCSMRLDKPIGPSQLEAAHYRPKPYNHIALIPKWDAMPEGIPLPEYENRVPLLIRQDWFKGLADDLNAPAVLGLNSWEDLL